MLPPPKPAAIFNESSRKNSANRIFPVFPLWVRSGHTNPDWTLRISRNTATQPPIFLYICGFYNFFFRRLLEDDPICIILIFLVAPNYFLFSFALVRFSRICHRLTLTAYQSVSQSIRTTVYGSKVLVFNAAGVRPVHARASAFRKLDLPNSSRYFRIKVSSAFFLSVTVDPVLIRQSVQKLLGKSHYRVNAKEKN